MTEKNPERAPRPRPGKALTTCIALLLVAGVAMLFASSEGDGRWAGRLEMIAWALLAVALFGTALMLKERWRPKQ